MPPHQGTERHFVTRVQEPAQQLLVSEPFETMVFDQATKQRQDGTGYFPGHKAPSVGDSPTPK
jgi:hypothetical protein